MSIETSATLDQDAQVWLAIKLGDEPLVPADARRQGPREVITVALTRLAELRQRRGRTARCKYPATRPSAFARAHCRHNTPPPSTDVDSITRARTGKIDHAEG